MQQSKLILLLKALSPGEFRRFVQFVQAPFFNTHERLTRLAEYLHSCAPAFLAGSLEKQVLLQVLFPEGGEVQTQQVHDHFSLLLKLLYQFLAQEQYQKDDAAGKRYLLDALAEKDQTREFLRTYRKAQSTTEAKEPFDYLEQFHLTFRADPILMRERKRPASDPLSDAVSHLDLFYLTAKLKYSCEMINRRNIINQEYHSEMLPAISQYLHTQGGSYLSHPLLAVYFQVYRMLSEPGEPRYFYQLRTLLMEKSSRISRAEAYNAYAFALNYCVKQVNSGKPQYLEELFDLYLQLLQKGLLLNEEGYISHEMAKNIVTVGLRLKRFAWVKDFLEGYRSNIHPDHRENAYTYNLAALYYEQQQYRQALKLLQQVTFTDVFYDLGARSLQLKMYFELEEDDSLTYLVKAFRSFLKRNKDLSRSQVRPYENLLRLANKAYRLKLRRGLLPQPQFAAKVDKLEQQLVHTHEIANVSWLKEKIGEMRE